jgi:hypothetical protein
MRQRRCSQRLKGVHMTPRMPQMLQQQQQQRPQPAWL